MSGYLDGDRLFEQRARMILPILVRQAEAEKPIFYSHLADELGLARPFGAVAVRHSLGKIGGTLNEIGDEWGQEVPHIQSLAISMATGMPGHGFDGFLEEKGYGDLSLEKKRPFLKEYWAKIFAYPSWGDVLEICQLERKLGGFEDVLKTAAARGGGGEGPEHAKLKEFIRNNPLSVGINSVIIPGDVEYPLPSGDKIDLLFENLLGLWAVEVKPASAGLADIARGLFQCVKYRAVLAARAHYEQHLVGIDVRLALGGNLPKELIALRNSLNIEVVENVEVA